MPLIREAAFAILVSAGGAAAMLSGSFWPDPVPPPPRAAASFVNWESPHVHPMALTPDRSRLLVVNTADARLEVFRNEGGYLVPAGSVPVGLDPVAVRARTNAEAWVVNHVSDSVSIVDLTTMQVVRTLQTLDEPCDVVFAGTPPRAFVSCSQANAIRVFDPANPAAAPIDIPILGEDPRSLGVSPDGSTVYAAVFESGNRSTVLSGGFTSSSTLVFPPNAVSDPAGPYGGVNPPPNAGSAFSPPIAPANLPAIRAALIVKKAPDGRWLDDNNRDWTSMVSGPNAAKSGRPVGWDLYDHDLAAIDTSTLSVQYATGLMNLCMAVGVNPATGTIAVVGTDATNQVRFEPNVNGRFLRVNVALVDPGSLTPAAIRDVNPHLTYATPTIPQSERDKSIGDPRAIAWNAAGTRAYVAGMGSNNLIVLDASGVRAGLAPTIEVGQGPTGLALDEGAGVLFVLNRFDASISVVSAASELELRRYPFFDPTPASIRVGRKHLYDTRKSSGLGHIACASCHADARHDRLAWDLGDPSGAPGPLGANNLGFGLPGLRPGSTNPPFAPFHAMKGPMTTQTLQGIIGLEPLHWRGDRTGIEAFNPAFVGLQGDDAELTPAEMLEFKNFLATITFPPNPYRNFDNTLPTSLTLHGHFATGRFTLPAGAALPTASAVRGLNLYIDTARRLDGGAFACVTCHTLPTGAGPDVTWTNPAGPYVPIPVGPSGEHHLGLVSVDGVSNISMKIPHLRNQYEKTGFNLTQLRNTAGFGLVHDGAVDSIERFVAEPAFTTANDQEVADLTAFMLAFSGSDLPGGSPTNPLFPPGPPSQDTHAAVGAQVTIAGPPDPAAQTRINQMLALANAPGSRVGLMVKGRVAGLARGYSLVGGVFRSDRAAEVLTPAALQALAGPLPGGAALTYTVVPAQAAVRMGIDRDQDGFYDRDEIDLCADPADPGSFPGGPGSIDLNNDGEIDFSDIEAFIAFFAAGDLRVDFNKDGEVDFSDIERYLELYTNGCS